MSQQLDVLRVLDGLEAMQADMKEAPVTMALIRDAHRALLNHVKLSVYLVECNAATLESMPKSWSQANKERFANIAKLGMLGLKEPSFGPHQHHRGLGSTTQSIAKSAIDRSEKALEDYAKSIKTKP